MVSRRAFIAVYKRVSADIVFGRAQTDQSRLLLSFCFPLFSLYFFHPKYKRELYNYPHLFPNSAESCLKSC